MTGCGGNKTTNPGTGTIENGQYIYKPGSALSLVVSNSAVSDVLESGLENPEYSEQYAELAGTLRAAIDASDANVKLTYVTDATAKVKHEIIFGRCNRELSFFE